MNEKQYEVEENDELGLAMVGTGYNEPSIVIEPERTVIERRRGELKEVVIPAFVKISTSFKDELPDIDGKSLKVWLYIALSVNRNTGVAHPGLRTIAKGTGMGVNTVQTCLKELEGLNLMKVDRKSRKYNIYEPTEYVSANRSDPVSERDTVSKTVSENPETVSENPETVSENPETVSDSQILNQRNQSNNQIKDADAAIQDLSIENQIYLGKLKVNRSKADEIKNALRKYFRLTPRWASKFDKEWLEWALSEGMTEEQIEGAAELWRKDKRFNWSIPSLKGIAEHWLELIGSSVQTLQLSEAEIQRIQQSVDWSKT